MNALPADLHHRAPPRSPVNEELLKIAARLTDLATGGDPHNELIGFAVVSNPSIMTYAALVKRLVADRRHREKHFAPALFADPVWDILLDLFLAETESRPISVSSATVAANIPPTTGLRCIAMLTAKGMILRIPVPLDKRKIYLQLSSETSISIKAYLDDLAARWSITLIGLSHAAFR
ncbi:hypothetical protein [Sphingomonas sp.]|uniref:hypothetical protein n=1 Tax=Sphingomonas sp. TaxID=28214 RepID=UPI0025F9D6FA|nr:hypothetical protein [Sphingomonas sp.]